NENWSVFASGAYDIESETLVRSSMGFAYGDECFDYSMTFSRTENTVTKETDFNVGFFLSFRTIGDFGTSTRELASN
ncbi:hypothetical protein NVV99_26695, partial [Rhodococcus sp. PAE-6]|uniref:hypothetical protein n=1 Tax=Rhodococcus sp. PAE-6 TaxID=2972477 RepID=UPI0021B4BB3C